MRKFSQWAGPALLLFVLPQWALAEATLRVALPAPPPGLGNPLSSTGTTPQLTWAPIFDALTMVDSEGRVGPWLATEWSRVGETRWRFRLREGVTFHNGRPFDAAAAKQVVDYLLSEESVTDTVRREIDGVSAAIAVDAATLDIETHAPFPELPRALAAVKIPDMEAWSATGRDAFALAPIGTGPFRVAEWRPARIRLAAYTQAWRPAKLDGLELAIVPDSAARRQAFLADQVDIAYQLGPDDIAPIESTGGTIFVRPLYGILAMTLQTMGDTPFADVRVRQAVNLAVNRQEIVDLLLAGRTQIASQPLPRHAFGYDPALVPYPYDPEAARTLLADAGYANGFSFVFEGVVGTGPNDSMIFQKIAADLAKVGIAMTIKVITYPELTSRIYNGAWKGGAISMDYATAPTLNGLRPFQLHSCDWRAAWYCDGAIMPTLEAARVESDEAKRLDLVRQVVRRYRDAAQSLFLYEQIAFDALGARVKGYAPRTVLINYDEIELSE